MAHTEVHKHKNRIKFLAIAIIAIVAISAVAVYASQNAGFIVTAPSSTPPPETVTIRISELSSSGNLVVDWAIEKGLFEEQQLNVVPWVTNKGGSAATQAIVAGSSDMHSGDFSLLTSAKANGADLWGFLSSASSSSFILATYADSPIHNITDLKGKTIGVSSFGSGSDLNVRALLTKYGLDPDKDAHIIAIGSGTTSSTALIEKTVDAATTSLINIEQSDGAIRIVCKIRDELPGFGGGTFYTSGAFLDAHPDAIKRFSTAIIKSEDSIRSNIDDAAAFYAKKADISEDLAKAYIEDLIETWTPTGHFEGREEGLNLTIDWMVKLGVIPSAIPLDQVIKYGYAP